MSANTPTATPIKPSALFWRTLVYVSLSLNTVFLLNALALWINITVRWEKRLIYALIMLCIIALWRGWRQRVRWPEHGWALLITALFMLVVVLDLLVLYNNLLQYVVTNSSSIL